MSAHRKKPVQRKALSPRLVLLLNLLAAAVIWRIDLATGVDTSVRSVYYCLLLFQAWYGAFSGSIALSFFCAWAWAQRDWIAFEDPATVLWNTGIRLSVFLILSHTVSKISRAHTELHQVSKLDSLTQLANRRAFRSELSRVVSVSRRYKRPFSLAFIDLDNFKEINDTLGHQAGDEILKQVGDTMSSTIRDTDVAARLGGDEFALLMPESTHEGSEQALNRIQNALQAISRERQGTITFSFGLASFETFFPDVAEALSNADELMYKAKRSGKNTVCAQKF